MVGGVGSDELTVLCERCARPIAARICCPVCGNSSRCPGAAPGARALDEALLEQVGLALAAQLELAGRTATAHMETATSLVSETRTLRGRLRHQRAPLRDRVAERGEQARRFSDALTLVNDAPQASGSFGFGHSDWAIRARLPRDPTCPAVARRLVEGHVRDDLDDRQTDAAMLIVSELVTDALVHGATVLVMSRHGDRLRIEVSDEGRPQRIGIVRGERRGAGGRGLFIVDQLASRWSSTAGTARVWAELPSG